MSDSYTRRGASMMSHSDFGGNDTAPYPAPPPLGPRPGQPDDDEADVWFEPVTYDQTDYQDLDAYLAAEGAGAWDGAHSPPGDARPAGSVTGRHDADHSGDDG